MGNCDPYSDPSEPVVVVQPKCTVEGADIAMQSHTYWARRNFGGYGVSQESAPDPVQTSPLVP